MKQIILILLFYNLFMLLFEIPIFRMIFICLLLLVIYHDKIDNIVQNKIERENLDVKFL